MNTQKITDRELKRSLNLIILAVCFGMAFFSVVNGAPFTGYIRALGAGDLIYGIVLAMPVIGSVVQVFMSYILENTGKRKAIFLLSGFAQRLVWIPIALIPLIIPPSQNAVRIWSVTVLVTIFSIGGSVSGVCFYSWAGVLVPPEIKGRYFSKRSMFSTITSAAAGLVAGKVLDSIHGFNGFTILFITVSMFGAADILCFVWVKHPPMEVPKERIRFTGLFLEPFRDRNYLRLILFVTAWNFGISFPGPFFNVYMLEYLKMSYFMISLFAQLFGSIATVLIIRVWGSLADRYGGKPVIAVCCLMIAIYPGLWIFATPNNLAVILALNFFAGVFWPGYDMNTTNLSIWLAPEKNRSVYMSVYSLVISVFGTALPYVCGGAFMQLAGPVLERMNLPFVLGQKFSNYHALFLLASLIRLLAVFLFLPGVKEENSTPVLKVIGSLSASIREKAGSALGR